MSSLRDCTPEQMEEVRRANTAAIRNIVAGWKWIGERRAEAARLEAIEQERDGWVPADAPAATPVATTPRPVPAGGTPVGDDYDRRATWEEVLEPAGWHAVAVTPGKTYWARPGKSEGHSATTGFCSGGDGADLLYVFSSEAHPFEAGKSYGKFRAFCLLHHGGDFNKATRAAAAMGYGPQKPKPAEKPPEKTATETTTGTTTATTGAARFPLLAKIPGPDIEEPDEGTDLAKLMAMNFPPPAWLATGVVPDEGLTILSGPKKSGKTWFLLDLALSVATGGLVLGQQCRQGPVLYYVLEDGLRVTHNRLLAMRGLSAGLDVRFYESLSLSSDASLEALCRRLERFKPAAVLIDNLTQAKGAATKENDNDAMGSMLGQVQRIALYYKVAVVLAHHAGRPKQEQNSDPGFMHRGASAISGCSVANLSIINKGYLVGEGRTYEAPFRWSMEFNKGGRLRWSRTFTDDVTGDDAFEIRPFNSKTAESAADMQGRAELWLRVRLRQGPAPLAQLEAEGNSEHNTKHRREWWRQRLQSIGAVPEGAGNQHAWHAPGSTLDGPRLADTEEGYEGERDPFSDDD